MSLHQVSIEVERSLGKTRFRFEAAAGPVLVMMVAVNKQDVEQPIWWLVPEDAAEFPFTVSSTPPAVVHQEQDSHRGHTEASWSEDEFEGRIASAKSNHEIRDLSYGEVPSGFRQVLPRNGHAPELQPGQVYVISVVGACYGQAMFEG